MLVYQRVIDFEKQGDWTFWTFLETKQGDWKKQPYKKRWNRERRAWFDPTRAQRSLLIGSYKRPSEMKPNWVPSEYPCGIRIQSSWILLLVSVLHIIIHIPRFPDNGGAKCHAQFHQVFVVLLLFDFQHLQQLRQDNFTAKMLSGDITSVVVMASMWKLSMTFITTLKMVFVMQLLWGFMRALSHVMACRLVMPLMLMSLVFTSLIAVIPKSGK